MRNIDKGEEPTSLAQHRCTSHTDYDNLPAKDKDELRQYLVRDQRGICCYCMSRIQPDDKSMKVEHWRCVDNYPQEQLDYRNLLAACYGNEGQPERHQHCDTYKGNKVLSKNPSSRVHQIERLIRFKGDGTICSEDSNFNTEINSVLNLNLPFLKNNRKATLDAFKMTLLKRGSVKKATIKRWLREWNGESIPGDLQPYCQVVVYWLRKRLGAQQ